MQQAKGWTGRWSPGAAQPATALAFASGVATAASPSPNPTEPCGEMGVVALPLLLVGGLALLLAVGVAILVLALGLTGPALSWLRWVTRRSPADADDVVPPPTGSTQPQGVSWLLRD